MADVVARARYPERDAPPRPRRPCSRACLHARARPRSIDRAGRESAWSGQPGRLGDEGTDTDEQVALDERVEDRMHPREGILAHLVWMRDLGCELSQRWVKGVGRRACLRAVVMRAAERGRGPRCRHRGLWPAQSRTSRGRRCRPPRIGATRRYGHDRQRQIGLPRCGHTFSRADSSTSGTAIIGRRPDWLAELTRRALPQRGHAHARPRWAGHTMMWPRREAHAGATFCGPREAHLTTYPRGP